LVPPPPPPKKKKSTILTTIFRRGNSDQSSRQPRPARFGHKTATSCTVPRPREGRKGVTGGPTKPQNGDKYPMCSFDFLTSSFAFPQPSPLSQQPPTTCFRSVIQRLRNPDGNCNQSLRLATQPHGARRLRYRLGPTACA
jgi:hypothetical protein